MRRDELIFRLESGEATVSLDCEIENIRWPGSNPCNYADDYTDDMTAVVSLVHPLRWTVTSDGLATVTSENGEVFVGEVQGMPCSALVIAWLKATE